MDISLDKNIRSEAFQDFLKLDSEKVILRGSEYVGRFTQPSMKRVSQLFGVIHDFIEFELMIYISDNEIVPKTGDLVVRSGNGNKYSIAGDVKYDFGIGCYTFALIKK